MALSQVGPILELLNRCADAALTHDRRQEAAEDFRRRFDPFEQLDALGYIAGTSGITKPTRSLVLSIIYVCGRKRPDDERPSRELRSFVADRQQTRELRTQAFMLLLLLDLEQAELATAFMPEMRIVVDIERMFPTVRRPVPGAAYEEATLKLLFH